jgi:predicted GIY-YIG superfamily endonuclease
MNACHIYVIAFDNGTIKVGRTQNLKGRLSAHKSDGPGAAQGGPVTRRA